MDDARLKSGMAPETDRMTSRQLKHLASDWMINFLKGQCQKLKIEDSAVYSEGRWSIA